MLMGTVTGMSLEGPTSEPLPPGDMGVYTMTMSMTLPSSQSPDTDTYPVGAWQLSWLAPGSP